MLDRRAVSEYWIKALGVSDITGLQGAVPRLLVGDPRFLWGETPNAAQVRDGERFKAALSSGETPSDEVPVCFCYCVPGPAVATVLIEDTVCAHAAGQEDGYPSEEQRWRVAGTEIVCIVPAKLHRDGRFLPRRDGLPMIVREHLEPEVTGSASPIMGDAAVFLREIARFGARPDQRSMREYWIESMTMFSVVSGLNRAPPGRGPAGLRLMLVPTKPGFATRHVARLYEKLEIVGEDKAPLIGRLLASTPVQKDSLLTSADAAGARDGHVAMVDRVKGGERTLFPLDPSQRRALHNVIALRGEPGIVAVSGPPGTGKTDMLRAIIANLWSSPMFQDPRNPWCVPFTLVCGATRQSVRNVMGAFDGAVRPLAEDPLRARWIPGLGGYASIFSAKSRLKEDGATFQTVEYEFLATADGGARPELRLAGKAADVGKLGWSDLPGLTAHFLDCMARALPDAAPLFPGKSTGTGPAASLVEQARDVLFTKLAECIAGVVKGRRFLDKNYDTLTPEQLEEWRSGLGGRGADAGWTQAAAAWAVRPKTAGNVPRWEVIEGVLDVALRWRTFHLAARYWEACWLLTLPERDANGAMTRGQLNRVEQTRRLAMLTPCVVSTLHSAPRLIEFYKPEEKTPTPGWGWVDMLVIDEAGQAPPELGAAALALTRQAVVVGDVKQLAPITQMVPTMEDPIAAARKVDSHALRAHHMASSTGSVMAMALRASSCSDPGGHGGIRLRNHYRCYPRIINFCVALKYNEFDALGAELVPKLRDPQQVAWQVFSKDGYPLPPMAFVQGGSPSDDPEGRETKRNQGEAEKIADWVEANGPGLLAWHRKTAAPEPAAGGTEPSCTAGPPEIRIEDLVKVVTPFRGQVEAIHNALKRFDQAENPDLNGIGGRMTVGTVHVLQGAEAPVILFSAVSKETRARSRQDPPDQQVFVDRDGGNLLNVAVSRAQKSFVLFGHSDLFFAPEAFDPTNDLPSALLGRYLAGVETKEGYGVKLGPRALVVVESAAKAKVINKVLGSDYLVFGTNGHFRELGTLDLDEALTPLWTLGRDEGERDERTRLLRRIGSRLIQTRHLILASDADREGEAIAWHFLQVLKAHPWWKHVETVSRVTFDSLSDAALRAAFANPVRTAVLDQSEPEACLDLGRARSALARALIDADLGATYWRPFGLRSGRVAAPLARMLAANLAHQLPKSADRPWMLDVTLQGEALAAELPATLVRRSGEMAGQPMRFMHRFSDKPGGPSAHAVGKQVDGRRLVLREVLPPRLLTVEPPAGLPTEAVLIRAWRRHSIPPHRTVQLLQQLYERVPESTGSVPALARATRDGGRHAIAPIVDGRMRLTEEGVYIATRLARKPLAELSDVGFAAAVNAGLDAISENPALYESKLAEWATRVRDAAGKSAIQAEYVGQPSGSFAEGASLWQGFPACEDGRALWGGAPPAVADWQALLADMLERASMEVGQQGGSAREAHPSLVPLSLWSKPDELGMAGDLRCIYALVWGSLVASVLRPARLRVRPLLFEIEGVSAYDLKAEVAELVDPGFAKAEPGLRAELSADYLSSAEFDKLKRGMPLRARVHGEPTHLDLARITPDHLLEAMVRMNLGRPSTYASHLQTLLG